MDMLSSYWANLKKTDLGWVHPDDKSLFEVSTHSFNLSFPPPAFIGDVLNAKIIILTANGGYKSDVTPLEFEGSDAEDRYISRLAKPAEANWSEVAPYYGSVNYAALLLDGSAASVNACAYRSPKISKEFHNRKLVEKLPSVAFHRRWLVEIILPDADAGKRLIIGKRHGLWALPTAVTASNGFIADRAPVSPHLSAAVFERVCGVL